MPFKSLEEILEYYPKTFVHGSNIRAKKQKKDLSKAQQEALPII